MVQVALDQEVRILNSLKLWSLKSCSIGVAFIPVVIWSMHSVFFASLFTINSCERGPDHNVLEGSRPCWYTRSVTTSSHSYQLQTWCNVTYCTVQVPLRAGRLYQHHPSGSPRASEWNRILVSVLYCATVAAPLPDFDSSFNNAFSFEVVLLDPCLSLPHDIASFP